MILKIPVFASEENALNWTSQHFPFSEHYLIREYPWSKIFKLSGATETGYLKLIPTRLQQVLKTTAVLSHYFKSVLPETIAINNELSLQLLRGHGGIELGSNPSEIQMRTLLSSYAKMQAETKDIPEIISSIPTLKLDDLLTTFLAFLNPEKESEIEDYKVNANYFLGSEESKEYYDVLLARKDILEDFLKNAALLPATVNHCDLRSENAAERNDGTSIIYDWDDALIGPAGLSCHAIFGSCFKITQFLETGLTGAKDKTFYSQQRLLNHYINELDKQGYAPSEQLKKALPASACAGAIQAMLTYAHFPLDDEHYIFNVNEYFVRRLDDILNLCDYLSCLSRNNALHFAQDYQDRNILFRSRYVYQQYLNIHPNDSEVYKKLAPILNQTGKWEEAIDCYQTIIKHNPSDAEAFNALGLIFLKNKNPSVALAKFEIALSITPNYKAAQINRDKATELLNMMDQALHPNKLPTAKVSSEEKEANRFSSEKMELASSLFKKHGALVAENVLDTDMLEAIKKMILEKYNAYFEPKEYDDCLNIGDKRHMVTLDIEGPINSPNLYNNPYISDILKKVLGEDYILGAINIGVSLPGAKNQFIHKDYPALFDEDDEFRNNTPCFAIGVLIPLVQHSHTVGTTLVIKDSHKICHTETQNLPGQAPFLELGSCLMIDYRVGHQGLANKSKDIIRPLLTLVFHRSWFRDCVNYKKQPPIKINDELFNSAPERLKELIAWAKSEAISNPVKLDDVN